MTRTFLFTTGILVGGNLCTFTPILGTQADATLGREITEGQKQRKLVRIFDFLRHFEGIRR